MQRHSGGKLCRDLQALRDAGEPERLRDVRYAGELIDSAARTSTGLYYIGARWMDPELGRWLSLDPELGKL